MRCRANEIVAIPAQRDFTGPVAIFAPDSELLGKIIIQIDHPDMADLPRAFDLARSGDLANRAEILEIGETQ